MPNEKHRAGWSRFGCALAVLLGLLASAAAFAAQPARPAAAPAELPPFLYGVSIQGPEGPPSDYLTMRQGGVRSVHFGVGWPSVERSPGQYDFARLDSIVAKTASQHLEAFPSVNGTPNWVDQDTLRLPVQSPAQEQAWTSFLTALVNRYGTDGDFWRQHPELPQTPIINWQIWNEPNFFYFANPRSPAQYAELVKISDEAISLADPNGRVILAGLFAHPKQQPPMAYQAADFLNGIYQVPGIASHFDGVALHPYATDASQLPDDINAIRTVMKRHHDEDKELWLTELGWGSGTDTGFEKGPAGQVRELTEAFKLLIAHRKEWRLRTVYWYAWRDLSGTCRFCDSVGLFTESGQPKAAWVRYVRFSGCFGRAGTVLGSDASERLVGTPGADVIVALGGDDRLVGSGGNDLICGGPGDDRIIAGAGNDSIAGMQGDDLLYLGRGKDQGFGGSGADLLAGSGGADSLFGGVGPDRLLGAAGADRLFGQRGNDFLFGGKADDLLRGGPGRDRLNGGPGSNDNKQ